MGSSEAAPKALSYDWTPEEKEFRGCELSVVSPNLKTLRNERVESRALEVFLGPEQIGMADFIREGSRREKTPGSLALPAQALLRDRNDDNEDNNNEEDGSRLWTRIRTQAVRFRPGEFFDGTCQQ